MYDIYERNFIISLMEIKKLWLVDWIICLLALPYNKIGPLLLTIAKCFIRQILLYAIYLLILFL